MTRLGAEVIHSGIDDVHATGHAKQEELKTLLSIAQPEWFTPVHGEYRHLTSHARLARSMGIGDERVLVCEDGDQLLLTDLGVTRGQQVPAGYLYVDGIVGANNLSLLQCFEAAPNRSSSHRMASISWSGAWTTRPT